MFTETDTWSGGSIELLCLFRGATTELTKAIQETLWRWPYLTGPYTNSNLEPGDQSVGDPADLEARFGVAQLPGEIGRAAFQTMFVEDDDGLWLYAGLPLGSLGRVLPVGAFPFDEQAVQDWELVTYRWLVGLAEHLHAQVPFKRAAVGWLAIAEVEELVAERIPDVRYHGYIVERLGQLLYFPPNRTSVVIR